jgi:predicted transcriptional regulator
MAYKKIYREKATELREKGYSLAEISLELGVSKSTVSRWVRSLRLNKKAKERLDKLSNRSFRKSLETRKMNQEENDRKIKKRAKRIVKNGQRYSRDFFKIFASLLFWCEGNKSGSYMAFINSDPNMISFYLSLLRKGFLIDEEKLRALVHVHNYHDKFEIKKFWSSLTKIPLTQFSKCYVKPSTGKRKRKGYKGSIRIRYYDSDLEKEMREIYTRLSSTLS